MARMRTTPRALAAALAGALLVTGCSSSDDGDATPPSYKQSDSVTARVLPQLAANSEDVESADDAAWVVDARIADVDEGTAVVLVAKDDDGTGREHAADDHGDGEGQQDPRCDDHRCPDHHGLGLSTSHGSQTSLDEVRANLSRQPAPTTPGSANRPWRRPSLR